MGSVEDKVKHSKRIKRKKQERVRSVIARELIVSGKYKQRIVRDKRGVAHDLNKMDHLTLVKVLQEIEDHGDE